MIISRTPFRISFCGGGTDLLEFYKHNYGAVTSTTINKYMYITVSKRFDDDIGLSYSKTEIVKNIEDIKHELIREAMRKTGVTKAVDITSVADIPARGAGLGSSSSFIVGLLNALYTYIGEPKSEEALAKEACEIEIDILNGPIGKQDQYIAAYGGLNYIRFNKDESVFVNPLKCKNEIINALQENLLLFYTGITREANEVLTEQKKNVNNKREILSKMVTLAEEIAGCLTEGKLDKFGRLLHENWILKKSLASNITNELIEEYYKKALDAGAIGGKILGAGGGGFLLIYGEKEDQPRIKEALKELRLTDFKFESQGSKIVYSD